MTDGARPTRGWLAGWLAGCYSALGGIPIPNFKIVIIIIYDSISIGLLEEPVTAAYFCSRAHDRGAVATASRLRLWAEEAAAGRKPVCGRVSKKK